ncbi:MAG: hypothetical protein R3F13_01720 [Prosthecobacter sp.]
MCRLQSSHILNCRLFVLLVAVLCVASCTISLVSSYDEVTDKAVQDLAAKTETVIADATTNGGSYRKHAGFYTEAQGSINAIEMRSSLYKQNEAEINTLGKLRTAMHNMGRIHQIAGSLRSEEAEGVRSLLRSLIHHQIAKKRSAQITAPAS